MVEERAISLESIWISSSLKWRTISALAFSPRITRSMAALRAPLNLSVLRLRLPESGAGKGARAVLGSAVVLTGDPP
jgi:hypothetical protein